MNIGDFLINGVDSGDIPAVIQSRPILEVPQSKTTENDEIPMSSGALLFSDEGYRNTSMELSMFSRGKSFEDASLNRNKLLQLFQQNRYNEFVPYFDEDKIYCVRLLAGSFTGNRAYGFTQPLTLSLSVKPFKRLLDIEPVTMTNGEVITNPTLFPSYPQITITGSGRIELTVNDTLVVLEAVNESIILDSEAMIAYRITDSIYVSENERMKTLDFPTLKSGENQISWTGTVTEVKIEPRWQVII